MRPERLQLEGFTAFREPTTVDFSGAELFALSGPTGAGKSSLIDAITFALYGTVPRYAHQRRIEPVISQGAVEARVRLDFSVDGTEYSAVRVARMGSRGGASTREARLQRGDEVLAGDADSVSAEVERLLGLSYAHFTTCVVLPQGEFQRFLHDTPRSRQDLLVQLLDLGVYERMAQVARQRASRGEGRLATLEEQLEGMEEATEEQARALERRHGELAALAARLEEATPRLAELSAAGEAAAAEAARARALADTLAAIAVPSEVTELETRIQAAMRTLEEAQGAHTAAAAEASRLEDALPEPGRRGELERFTHLHAERASAAKTTDELGAATAELDAGVAAAEVAVASADEIAARARVAFEAAQREEHAHALVGQLTVGDPCPLCHQVVAEIPAHEHPEGLAESGTHARAMAEEVTGKRSMLEAALREREGHAARVASAGDALARLDEKLAEVPPAGEVSAELTALDAAETAVRKARSQVAERQRGLEAARRAGEEIVAAQDGLRGDLDRVRAGVAPLEVPTPGHSSLAQDWEQLAAWAAETAPRQQEMSASASAEGERLAKERSRISNELVAMCAEVGVEAGDEPRQAVAAEAARLEVRIEAAKKALQQRRQLLIEQRAQREGYEVASALGTHLAANHFEKWVLDEALQRLVEGASETLHELSDRAYSLRMDKRRSGFEVVDHTSADAARSVRTLSGGETFLASLALALALADQIAEMAPTGAPRLESIFLDEGFGSLDLETLDTVAVALEELGARGRVVGVVSHVRELAERLPTRFEVRKESGSSTVERVDR